ncbi:hypothetical protein AYO20_10099 [Fonsecaea nubica]|uniref:Uncharacterized protein n=1 Tax=Fonsecaea nubica TaxID=856822 RepID=A0A178CCI0_9EURO|nr:hypothetical protein AYO20_10099 [Fonsecaea nubica]OAL26431.1 hypothetical protein AYO20_10099 [Fonsecaea nubica]
MDLSSTRDHQSRFSETSSSPPGTPASWISQTRYCKSSVATPVTEYSSSSWGVAGQKQPSQTSTADLRHYPAQNLQRKNSLLSWSLFRSRRPQGEHSTATNASRREAESRWWSSNPTVARKPKLGISPPVPLRPDSLHFPTASHADPYLSHHGSRSLRNDEQPLNARPVPPPNAQCEHHITPRSWTDLDRDKRCVAFARIDPDGWSKVIPKKWVEEQFSNSPSDTGPDDDRSVYCESNGEGSAACKLAGGISVIEDDDEEEVEENDDDDYDDDDGHMTLPLSLTETLERFTTTNVPCDGSARGVKESKGLRSDYSRAGLASSDPVRYWMSSLRPLPELSLAAGIQDGDDQHHTGDDLSAWRRRRRNHGPHRGFSDPSPCDKKYTPPPPTILETGGADVDKGTHRCKRNEKIPNLLVPPPLRLTRQRTCASPAATADADADADAAGEDGRNSGREAFYLLTEQHPEANSPQSSWATIYCPGAGSGALEPEDTPPHSTTRISAVPVPVPGPVPGQVDRRPAAKPKPLTEDHPQPANLFFKDKALPPLPFDCCRGSGPGRDDETRPLPQKHHLNPRIERGQEGKGNGKGTAMDADPLFLSADIDEILNLYLPICPTVPTPKSREAGERTDRRGDGGRDMMMERKKKAKVSRQDTSRSLPIGPARPVATDLDRGEGLYSPTPTTMLEAREADGEG